MAMVGFLQALNCTNLPSSWRHPESRDDSMSADYYQEIAGVLEAGNASGKPILRHLPDPRYYFNVHTRSCAA
jgi:hypothetical protein